MKGIRTNVSDKDIHLFLVIFSNDWKKTKGNENSTKTKETVKLEW